MLRYTETCFETLIYDLEECVCRMYRKPSYTTDKVRYDSFFTEISRYTDQVGNALDGTNLKRSGIRNLVTNLLIYGQESLNYVSYQPTEIDFHILLLKC